MKNSDYRFDVQLKAGLIAEDWFYEMTCGGDRFEVKHDRRALDTGNLYVEQYADPGRKGDWKESGLRTTEADCWIYALGVPVVCFIGVPTTRLRLLAQDSTRWVDQPHGSCPTKGVLLGLAEVLSPYESRVAA